jgi:hypothetical protein
MRWHRHRRRQPFDWEQQLPELRRSWPYDWRLELPSLAPPVWHDGMRLVEAS